MGNVVQPMLVVAAKNLADSVWKILPEEVKEKLSNKFGTTATFTKKAYDDFLKANKQPNFDVDIETVNQLLSKIPLVVP